LLSVSLSSPFLSVSLSCPFFVVSISELSILCCQCLSCPFFVVQKTKKMSNMDATK
jgi:hypothetical protein